MNHVNPANAAIKQLIITRSFAAPRALVWKAWTEPDRLKAWSGPRSFTTPVYNVDLRVGGHYLNCMKGSDGLVVWSTGTYLEIVPNEKLVLTDSFADDQGHVVSASHYGMGDDFPLESKVTILFSDEGTQAKFTLKYDDVSEVPDEHLLGMQQGWNESFDKLAEYLAEENK